ncbi:hypothetical protein FACHB389_20160 [Nostoc calcicola FACHB-389]|nr:hypothetical protein FACHB389_20160 [Nostoc calcicola FACHB-389]
MVLSSLSLIYGELGMGHGAWRKQGMGKGKGVRGKGERLNLFLFPLTFNLFPMPYAPIPNSLNKLTLINDNS